MLVVMSLDYPRPELNQTIIFDEEPVIDTEPVVGGNGRLMPGPRYSMLEFQKLERIVTANNDTAERLLLPTEKQLARITLNLSFGCWDLPTYQDKKNRARYGQMNVAGIPNASGLAHRTMYQVFYGIDSLPNKSDDYLDHLCERKPCCYPRHLERVTHTANSHRGRTAARHITGQTTFEF